MGSASLTEETYGAALGVLRGNVTPHGLRTSQAYYNQIWARDSFISFLGGNHAGDSKVLHASRETIDTFAKTRAPLGQIANFFDLANEQPEFGWSGSTDSSCWYIIGLSSLYAVTEDRSLLDNPLDAAVDAYRFVRYQDANNSWLVDSPQGADWMDAAIQRTGKTLYNNVLFLAATKCMHSLLSEAERPPCEGLLDYEGLRGRLNDVFLPGPGSASRISTYWPRLADHMQGRGAADTPRKYYLQYISFSRIDDHFDTLSNLLCALWGASDTAVSQAMIDFIQKRRLSSPYPVRVLDPPYEKGDLGYDDIFDAALPPQHKSAPLNYHNGAVWPFVGGFYVCALYLSHRAEAARELEALCRANRVFRDGEKVGFNEWLDGGTGIARGQYGQSWSAGMYIAAYLASRGADPFQFVR